MTSLPLLPDFDDRPKLVGIARIAAEGESLREGHNVEYFTLANPFPPQPGRERTQSAFHLGDQSLPRMRVCLQVLLCALHP